MPFEKGKSGNPTGRPRGVGLSAGLRKAIEESAQDIIDAMVSAAVAGDTAAGKALLDRVVPALKPQQQAKCIRGLKGKRLVDQGAAIIEAMGNAQLTPEQAQQMLAGLASLSKIIEVDDLEKRLTKLEGRDDDD